MKNLLTLSLILCCSFTAFSQCDLDFTFEVDLNGNIVTSNNSSGADPASYTWYFYNMDMNPYLAEYAEAVFELTYAPMNTGELLVCLIGTESGTNAACDSLCSPLTYTQEMLNSQSSTSIYGYEQDEEVLLYPSPASEVLFMKYDSEILLESIEARDMLGNRFLLETNASNGQFTIQVDHLPSGMYFLFLPDRKGALRFLVD